MTFMLRDIVSMQAFMEAVFETQAILIVEMDSGTIIHATRMAEEIFGYYVRGAMFRMNVDDLVPIALRENHKGHRADFAKRPKTRPMGPTLDIHGQHHDGHTFPVTVSLSAVMIEERPCVVAMIAERDNRRPAISNREPDLSSVTLE